MLFVDSQRLINLRINELIGINNRILLINEEKAKDFKEKLKKVEEWAFSEEEKSEENDNKLVTCDDSKDIMDTLDLIESEMYAFLDKKNNSEVSLDRMNSLIELKEFIIAYKKTNPSDLRLNRLKDELSRKILGLLDKKVITIEDTKTFYDSLDIQVVKNAMFDFKSKDSTKEEMILFSDQLDRINGINDYDKLFELYLGISYPTEEKCEIIPINTNYPSAYKKSTYKLVSELAHIFYDDANFMFRMGAVLKLSLANSGFVCPVYTLFTKSNGIISLKEKAFKEIEEDSTFFDDVIGCVIYYGIFGYENMKNLRFLYILNNELNVSASLCVKENPDLEYIYVQKISNPYYTFGGAKLPRLKEIHYESHSSEFSTDKLKANIVGNYKIIGENSNKILKKIYINRSE